MKISMAGPDMRRTAHVEILQTFIYYDGPLFFTCSLNGSKKHYLCCCVAFSEDGNHGHIISEVQFSAIKKYQEKRISMREAMKSESVSFMNFNEDGYTCTLRDTTWSEVNNLLDDSK